MPKREPIHAEPGSWHHLMLFTADRLPYFSSPVLATTMQSSLNAARERHGLRVVAYCIMPNTVQWLIQVTEYSLEAFALAQRRKGSGRLADHPSEKFIDRLVNDLRTSATTALRGADSRLPHEIWAGHFWHSPIDDPLTEPGKLAMAIASVHATPVRARLAERPGDYPYSSYAHIVYGKPSLVKIDRVPRNVPTETGESGESRDQPSA